MKAPRLIMVGVDGSGASLGALYWAAEAASASGSDLLVISAWLHDPLLDDLSIGRTAGEARKAHRAELDALIAKVVKNVPVSSVRSAVPEGDAAAALIDRSRHAALLVVGSHGKGRVREALAGSVGKACLRRASCPVTVIPPRALGPASPMGRKIIENTSG